MRKIHNLLFFLHAFVGVGAVFGGLAAILNPQSPAGVPIEALKFSPFSDFLIPGIILFTVLGLGNLASAVSAIFKPKYQGYISSVFGWALVIWIVVQCIMLWAINFLHVIFFAIGLVQAALAAILLFNQRLFPTNIICKVLKSLSNSCIQKES